jgi:N-acetylglutamate synthase-like GNAT family acetyltransferase
MQKGHVLKLTDGTEVTLRLLTKGDLDALKNFFLTLSDKSRQFLYDDVTDPKVIEGWIEGLNYDFVLPIVAVADGEIVADATLHKRPFGPSRHVGRIRSVVRDDFIGKGLCNKLIEEIAMFAKARKLRYLSSVLAEKGEKNSIAVMKKAGFKEINKIPGYLMDLDGNFDTAVVMLKEL